MSTAPTPTPETEAPGRSRVLWILGLIVIVVAAGIGLWLVFSDEAEPTATFDGQTATYSGPTTLTAGEITFTFDATDYDNPNGVMFIVARVTDDAITMEDFEALAASQPASGPIPPFVGNIQTNLAVGEAVESQMVLTEGRWYVGAHTAPQDTDRVHPAAVLEVSAE